MTNQAKSPNPEFEYCDRQSEKFGLCSSTAQKFMSREATAATVSLPFAEKSSSLAAAHPEATEDGAAMCGLSRMPR